MASKEYHRITDFLIAIAEPVSRPEHIHEYILTCYSLYAAVSVRLETEYIVETLKKYAKTLELPHKVEEFIIENTANYGKVKLVLRHNRYFLESSSQELLQELLQIESIQQAKASVVAMDIELPEQEEGDELSHLIDRENVQTRHEFEIASEYMEQVRKDCNQLYPLLEEYDFNNDTKNPRLEIDLKPTTHIRSYQEKCLSKMFSNGRARSGVIVLPCGAGKTLVGITAACTIKRRAIILCTSSVAVEQWKRQFLQWSTLDPAAISRFTSASKDKLPTEGSACIVISTYSMMGYSGKRSSESHEYHRKLKEVEWGLLIMDEVQVVPADMFRKVIFEVKSHCKVGLTATLVREDERIEDLNFLIGPKLYEANWLDLQNQGFLAKVQCVEVWCPMTPEFFQEYLNARSRKRVILYVANPNKLIVAQDLVRKHAASGDKIIIFSDNLYVLEHYHRVLGFPIITGSTSHQDRVSILHAFENSTSTNTLLISKVGDNSIDLPGANVIIQISSHFGSRRQEAQRLGRILRPKMASLHSDFNAFFYSLVSQDTQEMWYADKRQQFLMDQGYAYKVLEMNITQIAVEGLYVISKDDQKKLLERILQDKDIEDDSDQDADNIAPHVRSKKNNDFAHLLYPSTNGNYSIQNYKPRHWLFAKRYKQNK